VNKDLRNRILINILMFFSGIIAGVVGTAFYEVFGKPVLPNEPLRGGVFDDEIEVYYKRQSDGNFLDWVEPYEYLGEDDSFEAECKRMLITPLADTQPIKLR